MLAIIRRAILGKIDASEEDDDIKSLMIILSCTRFIRHRFAPAEIEYVADFRGMCPKTEELEFIIPDNPTATYDIMYQAALNRLT